MNVRYAFFVASLSMSALLFAPHASAEKSGNLLTRCKGGLSDEECKKTLDDLLKNQPAVDVQADFLVPDSPAFDVLGVTPEKVINPSSARSFGLSLLNGADPLGNIQTGFALDTAPYQFTGVSLGEYRSSYTKRFFSRSQLSLGTTKGSSQDDKSVRAAIGFRFTLIDVGDPRLDPALDATFDKIATSIFDSTRSKKFDLDDKILDLVAKKNAAADSNNAEKVEEIDKRIEAAKAELKAVAKKAEGSANKAWEEALKEHEKGTWNASSAALGVAPVFLSESGSYGGLESDGYAVYGTFAYGFDGFRSQAAENSGKRNWWAKNAQILLHARYTENQMEALTDGSGFRKQNTTTYGGQFRIQGPKIWSDDGGDLVFSLEGSVTDKDFADGGSESVTRYAGGFEVKPLKNSGFTLKGVIGGQSGGSDDDSGFIVSTLNWAL